MLTLEIIVNYLLFGCLFTILVDLLTEHARRKGMNIPSAAEWTWDTKILAICIWPLGAIMFVGGFIITYFFYNHKNKKK